MTVLFILLSSPGFAAEIRGKVAGSDAPNGLPNVSVTVYHDTGYTGIGAASDLNGTYSILLLPAGSYQVHYGQVGYKSVIRDVVVGSNTIVTLDVILDVEPITEKATNVITTSVSRHEVTVSNSPIRVEVLVPEEVQDKIAFTTSVDGALRYSGGIVVNTSRNVYEVENIRLRGVDSRYLLILNDQTPVLGYQPENVGIWTLPLVGIKQLEIVKGDYSALYGFGNAGLVNTVVRTPFNDSLTFFGLTRSDLEKDHYAGLYASRAFQKIGLSGVLSADAFRDDRSRNGARYVLRPRLDYLSGDWRSFTAGARMNSLVDKKDEFSRDEISFGFSAPLSSGYILAVKGQAASQDAGYQPDLEHKKAKTDLYYFSSQVSHNDEHLSTMGGIEGYREDWQMSAAWSDARSRIGWSALNVQNEWAMNEKWTVLYGGRISENEADGAGPNAYSSSLDTFRTDKFKYARVIQNHFLSVLWNPGYFTSARFTGSYGNAPLLSHYRFVVNDTPYLFVPTSDLKAEHFWTVNSDLRLIGRVGRYWWTGNISMFLIKMDNHVDIYSDNSENSQPWFVLANKDYSIAGLELFSRLDLGDDAAVLLGYTFLLPDNRYEDAPGTMLPVPHHQGNFELDWEIESTGLRVEIENKVVSEQKTPGNSLGSSSPPYVLWGATVEYAVGKVRVFGGVENLSDFVQNDAGPLWGPREGRQLYVGVKANY
jgi:outer membrane receptor for ferrienterochelin and colicin